MVAKSRASDLADHYIAVLSDWAAVTRRPLFGAIALRRNGLVFGMIWEVGLYFKTDEKSVKPYDAAESGKLRYTDHDGRSQALRSYAAVPADVAEDDDELRRWVETAYKVALSAARPSSE